ncbi:MAG: S-layer homology domain-containing protein, partial [Oscillospiraceae bacterium]|nr:S-layer homology domain-containing protein [Oscillospiraceae bacterium]
VELNEAEIKALETENSYISYEKMLKIIKDDPIIVFNDNLILQSKRLSTSTDYNGNVKNEWVMSFRYSTSKDTEDSISLSVEADAVTGEIISFRKYYTYGKNSPNKLTKKADRTAVRKRADEAGKHFLGERFSEYRCDGIPETTRQDTSINVRYTRYVNDLPVPADTLNISVDFNDEVLGFSYTYHDLKFPEAKLVGEDKAYEKLFKNMKPELTYEGFADLQLKSHIYLTYTFDSDFMLNALTGERVTYQNKPYYTEENIKASEDKEIKYTDIGGYKYENEINTLLAYGIYITDSDKLDPKGAITIAEFNRVSSILGNDFSSYYAVYVNGNYDKEATLKKMNKKLTRQELAMIYLRLFKSDYAAAAGVQGVFKSYYSDVPESSLYCGYITLARAAGLIKAKDGKFDPNGTLTRGEVLHILYTYLSTDKESELYELYSL